MNLFKGLKTSSGFSSRWNLMLEGVLHDEGVVETFDSLEGFFEGVDFFKTSLGWWLILVVGTESVRGLDSRSSISFRPRIGVDGDSPVSDFILSKALSLFLFLFFPLDFFPPLVLFTIKSPRKRPPEWFLVLWGVETFCCAGGVAWARLEKVVESRLFRTCLEVVLTFCVPSFSLANSLSFRVSIFASFRSTSLSFIKSSGIETMSELSKFEFVCEASSVRISESA